MYTLLIIFFLISIVVSFLCSLWEATLLSITPSYAQLKLSEGTRTGRKLQDFKSNIDRPLAVILTLNTIAHTVGAIGVGAQAAQIWSEANPLITSVLVPAVMTLAILILSEIIPKTIGATHWQALAPFTVNSVSFIIILLYPLVWLSQLITGLMKGNKEQSVFSQPEFLAMAAIGVEEGHVHPQQSEIIQNLFELHRVPVKEVMTPRTVVSLAPENMSIADYFESHGEPAFSRIPLHENHAKDAVTGYMHKNALMSALLNGRGDDTLSALRRDIVVVHENSGIRPLFRDFIQQREHIALVVNEFGEMEGIVTLEDLIETLLGAEIMDEFDKVEDMQVLAREKWARHVDEHELVSEMEDDETREAES
jgi:CBS domain containing-hemolysin-like protein